ncbi:hypothetical protein [Paracidovorax valerianellae]|uniref:hypothetical protein n=1 Tax=Paracidovorax valerianellae TaxID=187868 RepID=UPI00111455B6|nr:hypothetical protein [Paracidovorax valerianellae]MDA8447337.1 hypothetical protein [Paracidovorax valerianellae]
MSTDVAFVAAAVAARGCRADVSGPQRHLHPNLVDEIQKKCLHGVARLAEQKQRRRELQLKTSTGSFEVQPSLGLVN